MILHESILWTRSGSKYPEWIQQCHDLGLTVNIWTVNKTDELQWCIDNKADYITTDHPLETNRLLGK
ncbi:MAG: hypothetical protein IIW60_04620 [Alistipes sp.]|nr:hypothetical protein [Alistipes sp.]